MIGGPGAGKSTYSEIITKKLNIPHIYTGDMMRQLAKQDTPDGRRVKDLLSKGQFAPLSIVINAVKERVSKQMHKKDMCLMVSLVMLNKQNEWKKKVLNTIMLSIL